MAVPFKLENLFYFSVIFALISPFVASIISSGKVNYDSITLDPFPVDSGNEIVVNAPDKGGRRLVVFCYPGQDQTLYRVWTNVKLTVKMESAGEGQGLASSLSSSLLQVFYGDNETDVVSQSQASSYLPWPSLPWSADQYSFYPFNASCIGMSSEQRYTAYFTVKNPHHVYVAMALFGLALFFFAKPWSSHAGFHYGVGVGLGVIGSVLVVVIILVKFLPQRLKTITYVVGAVSTSLSVYLYQYLSSYLHDILTTNWKVLCAYFLFSGLLSFGLVYRYGPISDRRSLNLVKWSLQVSGLGLIYQSSHLPHVSMAVILVAVVTYNLPSGLVPALAQFRYRLFPPQRRLLTEDEFELEGEVETKKALEELRQFCRSPDCNAWKTIGRLNSPGRFSKFMEGDSHVSDSEFENHMENLCDLVEGEGENGEGRHMDPRMMHKQQRRLDMSAAGDTSGLGVRDNRDRIEEEGDDNLNGFDLDDSDADDFNFTNEAGGGYDYVDDSDVKNINKNNDKLALSSSFYNTRRNNGSWKH